MKRFIKKALPVALSTSILLSNSNVQVFANETGNEIVISSVEGDVSSAEVNEVETEEIADHEGNGVEAEEIAEDEGNEVETEEIADEGNEVKTEEIVDEGITDEIVEGLPEDIIPVAPIEPIAPIAPIEPVAPVVQTVEVATRSSAEFIIDGKVYITPDNLDAFADLAAVSVEENGTYSLISFISSEYTYVLSGEFDNVVFAVNASNLVELEFDNFTQNNNFDVTASGSFMLYTNTKITLKGSNNVKVTDSLANDPSEQQILEYMGEGTITLVNGSDLDITGDGELYIKARSHSPAIGSPLSQNFGQYKGGNINIVNTTIVAEAGTYGQSAVIGAGENSEMGSITINKSNVTAKADKSDKYTGIGAGAYAKINDVNIIKGSVVVADSSPDAGTAIGSNNNNSNSDIENSLNKIYIYESKVIATATGDTNNARGAAIGSGEYSSIREIWIEKSDITAKAEGNGAGIGSGSRGNVGYIRIFDSNINAEAVRGGAGIGSGVEGHFLATNIERSTIDAVAGRGGAGIGTGRLTKPSFGDSAVLGGYLNFTESTINAKAKATTADYLGNLSGAAAIGTGAVSRISSENTNIFLNMDMEQITIIDCEIEAEVINGDGAVIGTGVNGQMDYIYIDGSSVKAITNGNGAGIGTGTRLKADGDIEDSAKLGLRGINIVATKVEATSFGNINVGAFVSNGVGIGVAAGSKLEYMDIVSSEVVATGSGTGQGIGEAVGGKLVGYEDEEVEYAGLYIDANLAEGGINSEIIAYAQNADAIKTVDLYLLNAYAVNAYVEEAFSTTEKTAIKATAVGNGSVVDLNVPANYKHFGYVVRTAENEEDNEKYVHTYNDGTEDLTLVVANNSEVNDFEIHPAFAEEIKVYSYDENELIKIGRVLLVAFKTLTGNEVTENDKVIRGTGEPRADITVIIDEYTTLKTTVDDDGNWSVEVNPDKLVEGNVIDVTQSIDGEVIDEIELIVNGVLEDLIVNEVTVDDEVITGTGEPGADITVIIDEDTTYTTTVDEDGNWSVEVNSGDLVEGDEIDVIQSIDGEEIDSDTVVVGPGVEPVDPVDPVDPVEPESDDFIDQEDPTPVVPPVVKPEDPTPVVPPIVKPEEPTDEIFTVDEEDVPLGTLIPEEELEAIYILDDSDNIVPLGTFYNAEIKANPKTGEKNKYPLFGSIGVLASVLLFGKKERNKKQSK